MAKYSKQLLDENKSAEQELIRQLAAYRQHMSDFAQRQELDKIPSSSKLMYADDTPIGTPEEETGKLKSQLSDIVGHYKQYISNLPSYPDRQIAESDEDDINKFNKLRSLIKPI